MYNLAFSEIVRNQVKIMDMNLLCKPQAWDIINDLGNVRVNGRVVEYELICGIDYRFLTERIAKALKRSRFRTPQTSDTGIRSRACASMRSRSLAERGSSASSPGRGSLPSTHTKGWYSRTGLKPVAA